MLICVLHDQWAIFFAFSVTIAIDTAIAALMSVLLYRSQTGIKRYFS